MLYLSSTFRSPSSFGHFFFFFLDNSVETGQECSLFHSRAATFTHFAIIQESTMNCPEQDRSRDKKQTVLMEGYAPLTAAQNLQITG